MACARLGTQCLCTGRKNTGVAVTCAFETEAMSALLFGSITRIPSGPTSMASQGWCIDRVYSCCFLKLNDPISCLNSGLAKSSEQARPVRAVEYPAHCGG